MLVCLHNKFTCYVFVHVVMKVEMDDPTHSSAGIELESIKQENEISSDAVDVKAENVEMEVEMDDPTNTSAGIKLEAIKQEIEISADSVDVTAENVEVPSNIGNEQENMNDPNVAGESEKLSKRMQRKLRRREQWLAKLPEKRAKEREKEKLKRKSARENNIILPSRKRLKDSTMASSSCKVRVAVDLNFDDLMNPRDLGKCVKQLMRCYTLNRRATNPMQLYFTSFDGKSEEEMSKNNGYNNWDVHFESRPYCEAFRKEDIVYLSSESDNIVTTLDDSKVYVIGGLVDHNAHKGLCHHLAEEKNVAHAQLPISEFLELKSRKVLTIDHVFEILLGVTEGLSWKEAFLKVLPQRKGAIIKEESNGETKVSETGEISKSTTSSAGGSVIENPSSNDMSDDKHIAAENQVSHSNSSS